MNPQLTHIRTSLHTAERHQRASEDRRHRAAESAPAATRAAVTIRPAYADDAPDLGRLAQLDEAAYSPAKPALLAEIDGIVRAVLLDDGSVISDPFVATAGAVALLRLRARQTAGPRRRFSLARLAGRRRVARTDYASAGSSSASSRAFG